MYLSSTSTRLLLHDTSNWKLKLSNTGGGDLIRGLVWSDDGKYMLKSNAKLPVEILLANDKEVRVFQSIPNSDGCVATFHRDGYNYVALGSQTGRVIVWDTKLKSVVKSFPTPTERSKVNFVSFNVRNDNLAATMENGDTVIYGLKSNSILQTVKVPRSKSVSAMKFHYKTRALIGLATDEGHVLLKDLMANKDKLFIENAHSTPVSDFIYSPVNTDVLLSCGYDKYMHVYDVRNKIKVLSIHAECSLSTVDINTDNHVALGTKKGLILIYDLRDTLRPLKIIKDHIDEVRKVAFQPRKSIPSNETSITDESYLQVSNRPVPSAASSDYPEVFEMFDSPCSVDRSERNVYRKDHSGDKADSFLVMMGLDKSMNNSILDDSGEAKRKSVDFVGDRSKLEVGDGRMPQIKLETASGKSSTPINKLHIPTATSSPITPNSCIERADANANFSDKFLHPANKITNYYTKSDSKSVLPSEIASSEQDASIHSLGNELKDFIRMSMADLAEDSRNSFLHMMLILTKQKLFLEKEVSSLTRQMHNMQRMQNNLVEVNKSLLMEVELLKSTQHLNK